MSAISSDTIDIVIEEREEDIDDHIVNVTLDNVNSDLILPDLKIDLSISDFEIKPPLDANTIEMVID